jgi:hypothetical protein
MRDLYLCGPMAGLPDNNAAAFRTAARELRAAGYTVHSPGELDEADDKTWLDYMRDSLLLIADSRNVAYLPGSDTGNGSRIELDLTRALGLTVRPVNEWLKEGPR